MEQLEKIGYKNMQIPDYNGNSIVNLMSSILDSYGGSSPYNKLELFPSIDFSNETTTILFVIDGLGYKFLKKHGKGTVFNDYLLGEMTSVFPTTTSAAMTSFYTGLAPQNHAIPAWFTYLRELGIISTILLFKPRGYDFLFKNQKIPPAKIYNFHSLFDSLTIDHYSLLPKEFVESAYTKVVLEKSNRVGFENLEDLFKKIVSVLQSSKRKRKFILAYWPDFDEICHKKGIQSQEALQHFHNLDSKFKPFLKSLKNIKNDLKIIITADHGLIDTTPEHTIMLKNHPELYSTMVLPLCGEPRAPFFYVRPSQVEKFEKYIHENLSHAGILMKGEDLIKQNYFGLFDPHPQLFDRIGDYVLLMKDNYIFRDQLLCETRHELIGNHGGLSDDELFVPLIII